MSLNKGKHLVQELEGVLCTVVETGLDANRLKFMKELLEFNHFEVKTEEVPGEEDGPSTFTVGVTDLVFNPVIAVYEQSLKRPEGGPVSPAFWNQEPIIEELPYYDYREKNPDAKNEDDFSFSSLSFRSV
jgi:hypothetical protein